MRRLRPHLRPLVAGVVLLLSAALTACSGQSSDLTIYSGRNPELVDGLLQQLEEQVGGTVAIRYAGSAELAAQLLEEGDATEADVFFSQDAGALGALDEAGRLQPLPPVTLEALVDPKWKGRIGYPPTNPSWQAFVTSVRVLLGEEGARQWLTAFAANEPKRYDNNILTLDAVDRGEIALGLSNHYYWYERVAEVGLANVTARVHYVPGGSPLGLVNVAGAGVIGTTDNPEMAQRAVDFLVGPTAQQYFADVTAEYPVRPGVTSTVHDLAPLDSLQPPDIDLSELASLQQTQSMLQETGLA